MNNKLYGNLIFELSRPGRRAYSLPKNRFAHHELPAGLRREQDAELPECDEMTVVRHYTNHSENNFGVLNGFYPLGSCTMKYNPRIDEEMAALPGFAGVHPLAPEHAVASTRCSPSRRLRAPWRWSITSSTASPRSLASTTSRSIPAPVPMAS